MNNFLELLYNKLYVANQSVQQRLSHFGSQHLMTKALAEVKQIFDAPTSELPERSIARALEEYHSSGILMSYLYLTYSCLGVGQRLPDGWCLFDDDQLFSKLLQYTDDLRSEPRRFRRCYQGLLSSYFSYPIFTCEYKKNWEILREYLIDGLPVAKLFLPVAGWLSLLEEHKNLLGPNPCERYVEELRNGAEEISVQQTLREGLGISRESWVWQELVLSQVEVTCRYADQPFKDDLDRMISLLQSTSMLSENLVVRCTAKLLSRYAQCVARPEHTSLRDAAVNNIGNPWLKKTAWDAHVKTSDGHPHEAAREMVNGWINRELIKNFFELLSDDGSADQRRLKYWLHFEPVIEEMWFALGPHARNHPSPHFADFRSLAQGRTLRLESPGSLQNNAFIMRMGAVTIVEFGSKGNAAYIYQSEEIPFDLSKNWINGDRSGLKNQSYAERFSHRDFASTGTNWEEKLDTRIFQLINFRPVRPSHVRLIRQRALSEPQPTTLTRSTGLASPTLTPTWEEEVKIFCNNHKYLIEDNRPSGRGFWVLYDWPHSPQLERLGFKFKSDKGWWRE